MQKLDHVFYPGSPSDRVQRLKDARAEALKEIETLKASKNAEFIEYEKKVWTEELNQYSGDSGDNVKQAERETEAALKVIASDFSANKQSVIDKLLLVIGDCKPQVLFEL